MARKPRVTPQEIRAKAAREALIKYYEERKASGEPGKLQEKMADEAGVSCSTFNSWITRGRLPRGLSVPGIESYLARKAEAC